MRNRYLKSRVKFSPGSKPANFIGSFKNQHTLAMLRQIGGAHQSIVPRTDDDRVVTISFPQMILCNSD